MTPVKNREQCDSCWALSDHEFSRVPLSEQQLVDCVTIDFGCIGKLINSGFASDQKSTMCTEISYCYTATQATCKDLSGCSASILPGGVVEFTDVSTACNSALKSAFVQQPVFVAIETDIVSTVLIWCIDLFMRVGTRSW